MRSVDGALVAALCALVLALVVLGPAPRPRSGSMTAPGLRAGRVDRRLVWLVGPVGGVVLGSPVLLVVGPLAVWCVGRERARRGKERERVQRAEMALAFVAAATSGLRAGRSLAVAVLEPGSGEVSEGQREVAERVAAGWSLGRAVDDVLGGGSVDERLIATTVVALDTSGAPAFGALERVEEALGERRSSREEARTQAQQALSSAAVLALLPFVFGCAAALAEPEVGRLYATTWVGAGCVVVGLGLVIAGWEWMQRLLGSDR